MNSKLKTQNSKLALIALGSNLGNSREIIFQAMEHLQELSSGPLLKSSLWKTTPIDCPPGSPDFINAVVGLIPLPKETPESLLEKLQRLEKEFGRQPKKILNETRPLDLDLVAFGSEIRSSEKLILAHPRARERRFVLQPLAEIAPDFILPGEEKSVRQLLDSLQSAEDCMKLL